MSAAPPPAELLMSISVAGGVMAIYGLLCPALLDAARADSDRVDYQQSKALVASLVLGAAGACATRSPWPLLIAVAAVTLVSREYGVNRRRGPAS